MENEELSTNGSSEKTLPLRNDFCKSKRPVTFRKGAISKKKMDDDYENHKKFKNHIWKITPTWRTWKDEDTKRKAKSPNNDETKEHDEEENKQDSPREGEEKHEETHHEEAKPEPASHAEEPKSEEKPKEE